MKWVRSEEQRVLERSIHYEYTMPNKMRLLCYRTIPSRDWHINVSYEHGGNVHNSGHRYRTLKEAKDAAMYGYFGYLVYRIMGKWDRQTSFLERDWPGHNANTPLRLKSILYGIKQYGV